MSRSNWALAETRRRGVSVHGAGEHRRFDGRLRRERRLLPSAVSATKYTVLLLAAGMLVMAVEPARALAAPAQGPGTSVHADRAPPDRWCWRLEAAMEAGRTRRRVRSLQRRLDGAGYSPGPIDGRYGPRTEQAVERFQSAHGLRVDGIAGPLTLAALRSDRAVSGSGLRRAGPRRCADCSGSFAVTGISPGPIDGRYGPRTERAVSRFQSAHGLNVDGIAGPQTFGELKRLAAGRPTTSRPTPGSHPPAGIRPTTPARRPGPGPSTRLLGPQPGLDPATRPAARQAPGYSARSPA